MIEILSIKIDRINGDCITVTEPIPAGRRFFKTPETLDQWRTKKEMKLQFRSDEKFGRENPKAAPEDYPRVRLRIDTRREGELWYVQNSSK